MWPLRQGSQGMILGRGEGHVEAGEGATVQCVQKDVGLTHGLINREPDLVPRGACLCSANHLSTPKPRRACPVEPATTVPRIRWHVNY